MSAVQCGTCQEFHLSVLAERLGNVGLDICYPFPVQLFNAQSPAEHQLPTFGRSSTLAVVIGNSNRLWRPFVAALAQSDSLMVNEDNPLDAYVEREVSNALQQAVICPHDQTGHHKDVTASESPQKTIQSAAAVTNCEVRFSHHTEPSRFINMLRAAQISGLAYYSNTTHLCLHPEYGPWFALRAVAVIDVDGPNRSNFRQLPCPHSDLECRAAAAIKQLEAKGGLANWQQHWREWAELRSIGGEYTNSKYRYSVDQLEYHYTKCKDVLARAVNQYQREQLQLQDTTQQSKDEQLPDSS